MKNICFVLLCVLTSFAYADNINNLVGEWEQFGTGSEKKYTYFRYNADGSGVFATVRGDRSPNIDTFKASQVKINDEIVEVNFTEDDEYKAKLLLAGYNYSDNEIATGMLYMYMKDNGKWRIFNTVFIRLINRNNAVFLINVNKLNEEINWDKELQGLGTQRKTGTGRATR